MNPIGALSPTPGPAESSAAAYVLTPATGGAPGPEAEQMTPSYITAAASSIRVFLLIENRLLRESLVRLFRKRPDLLVVGQCGQAEATPCHVLDSEAEVLVTDSFLTAWLPANLALQNRGGAILRAVLIGMELDEEQFLAAARSGVTGYLLKDASASDVIAAVRAVFRGEAVCPPQLVPRYSASLFKRLEKYQPNPQLRDPILLCASSSWLLSSPRVSQIRKSLLTSIFLSLR